MSKRYNFNIKQSVSKKPKLDISIISSQSVTAAASTTCRNSFPKPKKPEPQPQSNNSLWDDDDDGDELILLASQQIEFISGEQHINASSNLDISYTSFGNNARSSTQRPQSPPPTSQNEAEDLDEFFLDDMDNDFPNLTNFVGTVGINIDNEINAVDNFDSEPLSQFNNFKMPTVTKNNRLSQPGTCDKRLLTSKAVLQKKIEIPSNSSQAPASNYTSKKDRENTVRVNMLQNSLDKVCKEHTKLKTDFSEITNKMQTKDGENSMLRYELNIIKKQNEQYRLAKIQENDNVKMEWLEKIKILEKDLKTKETAMEFLNIEMTNMKNRKLNDSIRNLDVGRTAVKEDFSQFQSMFTLNIPINYDKSVKIVLNSEIFQDWLDGEDFSEQINKNLIPKSIKDSIHLNNLRTIQSLLAQTIADTDSKHFGEIIYPVIYSVVSSFKELRNYALNMEYSKYTDLQSNPRMEHNFLCEMSGAEYELLEFANIFQNEKMSLKEKAVNPRRIIAALSLTCKYSLSVSKWFVNGTIRMGNNESDEMDIGCSPIDFLADILKIISFSNELFEHIGIIIASCSLLSSLSFHLKTEPDYFPQLVNFFKILVTCRVTAESLAELSSFLNNMVDYSDDEQFINSLCWNSEPNELNECYKILQFSPNACVLQLYGSLMEVAFPPLKQIPDHKIVFLLELILNTMSFFRKCIAIPAKWAVENTKCDCYNKLATGFIVLFHQLFEHWIKFPDSIGIQNISKIARMGCLVICDIFHINFKTEVLQVGGNAIKYRLQVVYNWLVKFGKIMEFKTMHYKALEFVNLRLIIPNPLEPSEEDLKPEDKIENEEIRQSIFNNFI